MKKLILLLIALPTLLLAETFDQSMIRSDWPALHTAIAKEDFSKAKAIMEVNPGQIKMLASASINGNQRTFLEKLFAPNYSTGYSSLELAIQFNASTEFIEYLIKRGFGITFSTNPLELIHNLTDFSLDLNYVRSVADRGVLEWGIQKKALHGAIEAKRWDLVELLLRYGANLNHLYKTDHISLYKRKKFSKSFAFGRNYPEDLNALELAITHDAPLEIIQLLIQMGADVNHTYGVINFIRMNFLGSSELQYHFQIYTPLYVAIKKRNFEAAQLILDAGVNINEMYQYGQTLLEWENMGSWEDYIKVYNRLSKDWSPEEKEIYRAMFHMDELH